MTTEVITSATAAPSAPDADYESTRIFNAPPDAVFAALTTPAALSSWWVNASGSGLAGGELTFDFGSGPLIMRVDRAVRPTNVRWAVLTCEPVSDWVGTTISFDLEPIETGGTRLYFRHIGLTPQLECFDMCRQGWDHYLPSLVNYVNTDQGSTVGSTNTG